MLGVKTDRASDRGACLHSAPPALRPSAVPPPDHEATQWFAEHVQPHEAMLRAWLTNRFDSRIAVDDIVQETHVRVLRARAHRELHAPKAFLFITARNLALDYLRRHHVARTGPLV
jgi:DNA-directed RNA polymerase specialized sigma24 family protein